MSENDSKPLTRDLAPFGVRMPPDLKDRVQSAAADNNRSMNAEIVGTLEVAYPKPFSPAQTAILFLEVFGEWSDAGVELSVANPDRFLSLDPNDLAVRFPEKSAAELKAITESLIQFAEVLRARLPNPDKG